MKPWEEQGGSAFPICQEKPLGAEPGMTLRDWFAGQALVGMNASITDAAIWPTPYGAAVMAEAAYRQADAMLKARKL